MKRIGYIQGARIRGPVNLGPLGTIDVAGISHLRGMAIMYAGLTTAGVSTFGGIIIAGAGLSVAGLADFGGAVLCHSSLQVAVGGLLRFPQVTNATDLPAAAAGLPTGSLWSNANIITRVP